MCTLTHGEVDGLPPMDAKETRGTAYTQYIAGVHQDLSFSRRAVTGAHIMTMTTKTAKSGINRWPRL